MIKRKIFLMLFTVAFCWAAVPAFSAPPYDVAVTFDAPITGGAVDGYNFYIDDCAVTGAVGAAVGAIISGQTFVSVVTADGTYQMCVRAFNLTGENPDPGPVATVEINDLPLPGTIQNLGIQVTCPGSNCTINVTVL